MEDTFPTHFFMKGGDDRYLISGGNDYFQLAHYKGSNGSARSDNNEEDWFENTTKKLKQQTHYPRFYYGKARQKRQATMAAPALGRSEPPMACIDRRGQWSAWMCVVVALDAYGVKK